MAGTSWDVDSVLELLRSFHPREDEVRDSVPIQEEKTHHEDSSSGNCLGLGDLNPVLRFLGKPIDIPRPKQSNPPVQQTDSSDTSPAGSYDTAASSLLSDAGELAYREFVKSKEVRFSPDTKDEVHAIKPRKAKRSSSLDADELERLIQSSAPILGEEQHSPSKPLTSSNASHKEPSPWKKSFLGAGSLLTPAWVTPPPKPAAQPHTEPSKDSSSWLTPDVPHINLHRSVLRPLVSLTKEEKKAVLIKKLRTQFPDGPLCNLMHDVGQTASRYGGNASPDGLHIFIDASNIVIGFADALKANRGLDRNTYTRRPAFDFHSLSLVLERGRPAAKRILCGSLDNSDLEPDYMVQARKCDYSVSVLKRVMKARPVRDPIARKKSGNGYATSGPSSGSDANVPPIMKNGEQAVDELLHLNMCDSILETEKPATIVLATGDAAEAEYSGGFLKYVEVALNKGWKVELVCWRKGMAYAWKQPEFLEKWRGKFRIIHLDKYCEELFGVYAEASPDSDWSDGEWSE